MHRAAVPVKDADGRQHRVRLAVVGPTDGRCGYTVLENRKSAGRVAGGRRVVRIRHDLARLARAAGPLEPSPVTRLAGPVRPVPDGDTRRFNQQGLAGGRPDYPGDI